MSWKKHFQSPSAARKYQQVAARYADDIMSSASPNSYSSRFASWLPEVYSGQPNRIERYSQYDNMDLDTEINMALDTIADSSTQIDPKTKMPFIFEWADTIGEEEVALLKEMLRQWVSINKFECRMHRIFRSVLKYGDQFFVRDPETFELFWVAQDKVDSVIVDEAKGKEPEEYVIRDLDVNLQTLVATGNLKRPSDQRGYSSGPMVSGNFGGTATGVGGGSQYGSRFGQNAGYTGQQGLAYYVDSDNVVHMSVSEGLDNVWPFGVSILENIFKTFKQKELIEDAVIIYRVQRAPERRVFYIDTGRLPNHRAMAYLERIKNEIQQKRIPSRTGGQNNILDATYNPMSMLEDYFFAQNCLSLCNKITFLDGKTRTLGETIKEFNDGNNNLWVYTINPKTYKMEPGKVAWAGITRKNAQVLKVTLDNGEEIIATPDHKFITRNGREIEAQNLKVNMSLMPLYLKTAKTDKIQNSKNYVRYIDNSTGKTEWVHLTVCPKTQENTVIHHIDFNGMNNNPNNLIEMDEEEHKEYHKAVGTYSLQTQWNDPEKRQNLLDGMRKLYNEGDEEFYQRLSERNRQNALSAIKKKTKGKTRKQIQNILHEQTESARKMMVIQNTAYLNLSMFERMKELFFEHSMATKNIHNMSSLLEEDDLFMDEYKKINEGRTVITRIKGFNADRIKQLCDLAGYHGYKDFKENFSDNHKVVAIDWLNEREDTGDLTIESPSGNHNFALAAGIYVHNSDGKGSRVETLPGGDQLGQVDDLKYFHHKLRNGLRVPRSYMPDFDDGGGAIFNDGRIGTAYIEELRFTRYCERLQNLIAPQFDTEFKLFCKFRGINIHSSSYKLRFVEPQNFSKYRQTEVDGSILQVLAQAIDLPGISRRFAMKRYGGWTEDEILENEKSWAEENSERVKSAEAGDVVPTGDEDLGFGDVGASAGGLGAEFGGNMPDEEGFEDLEGGEEGAAEAGTESPISGNEGEGREEEEEI